ncbi:phage-like protein [Salmonella bongori]|nr:phage-like protein [Salmonella bongori]
MNSHLYLDKIQECILGHFQEFEDFLVGKA